MRLIDLDELLRFPIRRNHCDKENANPHFINGIETVFEYAEQLPTFGWIPVTERLPERDEFVLLSYSKNNRNPTLHAKNTMAVGRYEYGMFLVDGCCVKVTHWMPLPNAPKDGE